MSKEQKIAVPEVGREFTLDARESLPSGGYRVVTLHVMTLETQPDHLILALQSIETSDEGYEEAIPHSEVGGVWTPDKK